MPRITLIAGTRPEVIKLAPVFLELRESRDFEPYFLSTGQHREMLDQALAAFDLVPDCDLNLMTSGQTLPELTARIVAGVAGHLRKHRPDAVLLQGDTTTVLASALAAFYERIPIGHVEAGLRTHDMGAPWPEEMNRRLVSPLCRWNFAPTAAGRDNLEREHIDPATIHVTGNTVIDALRIVRGRIAGLDPEPILRRLGVPEPFAKRYMSGAGARWVLVTGHRRESFGDGFRNICKALARLTELLPEVGFLYPVHLNPKVREPVSGLIGAVDGIALVEPAAYQDFVWLMAHCTLILSDSGGVQEEAPSLGKPVLVMRDATERPEAVLAGTSRLVGTNPDLICRETCLLLTDPAEYRRRSTLANPYGDGHASSRILAALRHDLCPSSRP